LTQRDDRRNADVEHTSTGLDRQLGKLLTARHRRRNKAQNNLLKWAASVDPENNGTRQFLAARSRGA
jgi:hypothetical protein